MLTMFAVLAVTMATLCLAGYVAECFEQLEPSRCLEHNPERCRRE